MRKLFLAAVAAVVGMTLSSGWAMFINSAVQVPVDRTVANVEAWIKEKPQDAQAYYVLGRIHAMAWAYGKDLNLWKPLGISTIKPDDPFGGQLPGFAPYDSVRVRRDEEKKDMTAEDAKHLEGAIRNYTKATELDPKNALSELGLAWILQETGKVARNVPESFMALAEVKVTDAEKGAYEAAIKKLGDADAKVREEGSSTLRGGMPKAYGQLKAIKSDDPEVSARVESVLKGYWELQALEHYRKAYGLRIEQDLGGRGGLRAGDSALAQEAGEAILEILKGHPEAAKEAEVKGVSDNIKTLQSKPMAVTPVIFAMPGVKGESVGDLLDSSKRVAFDLAGDGVARQWPWLKDGTALLVWDPAMTGKITNARQLFGGRTWWIFFRDGYEALSVLDDNRDGQLTGDELQGIAVWIDKNGDGISQAGEVISLEQARITAIGVRPKNEGDQAMTVSKGVTFTDGRSVPTFDWVTMPVDTTSSKGGR